MFRSARRAAGGALAALALFLSAGGGTVSAQTADSETEADRDRCERGDARGCLNLGAAYRGGLGV